MERTATDGSSTAKPGFFLTSCTSEACSNVRRRVECGRGLHCKRTMGGGNSAARVVAHAKGGNLNPSIRKGKRQRSTRSVGGGVSEAEELLEPPGLYLVARPDHMLDNLAILADRLECAMLVHVCTPSRSRSQRVAVSTRVHPQYLFATWSQLRCVFGSWTARPRGSSG